MSARAGIWLVCSGICLGLCLGTSVSADVLYLQQGGRIEGDLLNPDESPRRTYELKTIQGVKLHIPSSQVERVVVKSESERRYEQFAMTLPDTPAAHWDAAERCAAANLGEQRTYHLEQVIRLDPEHEKARHALGYSRLEGKWARQDETMEKRGFVRDGGTWKYPQELEMDQLKEEAESHTVKWRKDLNRWRDWLFSRDPQKSAQGEQAFRTVRDPAAAPALIELLRRPKEPTPVRLMYLDVLAQFNTVDSLVTLVKVSLEDGDQKMREKALEYLAKSKSKQVVRQYMKMLKHEDNTVVRRAAVALERMGDAEATPALIDALITTHKFVEGSAAMNPSFSKDGGGGGLSMGGGPKVVKKKLNNEPVLRALQALNPGTAYGYDQQKWRVWYASTHKPAPVASLRRSE